MARTATQRIKVNLYRDAGNREADQDSESPQRVAGPVTAEFHEIRLMGVSERNPDGRQVRSVETYRMQLVNSDAYTIASDMWAVEVGSGRRWNFMSVARPPGRGGTVSVEVKELVQ